MLSRPQTTLLALLAASSLAQAGWNDDSNNELARRQGGLGILTPLIPTITSPTPSNTGSESTSTRTSSSTSQPSSTSATTTESSSTTTTSSSISSTPTSSSSTQSSSEVSSTSSTITTTSSSTIVTTPSPSVVRVTQFTTVDGSVITSVSESTSMVKPTNTASLNQDNENSGGGMSSKTRGTVIGVVVGIGGAALLGGLAVVAWRIWGRKKSADEGDDFEYGKSEVGTANSGNSSAGGSSNPFQSTLESYHNPAKVNASSNF